MALVRRLAPADEQHLAVPDDEAGCACQHRRDASGRAEPAAPIIVHGGDDTVGVRPRTKTNPDGGFKLVLLVGAIVSTAIAVWALVWTGMLETVLGLDVPKRSLGIVRVFGGVMLAVGIGYALAAAQPQRSRSLLVPLFVVPLVTAITTIAGVSRDEITGGKGIAFAVFNLGYCLFYFRMYPRVTGAEAPAPEPPPDAPKPR